jgi:hypothetical protein
MEQVGKRRPKKPETVKGKPNCNIKVSHDPSYYDKNAPVNEHRNKIRWLITKYKRFSQRSLFTEEFC